MKYPKTEENIAAMKELLHWYETGEDEGGARFSCPLCTVNDYYNYDDLEGCQTCPWVTLHRASMDTGECPCNAAANAGINRSERDPDFLATRIPQLKEWINTYEQALRE